MNKNIMGIDFGSNGLKFSICKNGAVERVFSVTVPDNLVQNGVVSSPEAMAEFLKKTISAENPGCRHCSVVLSPSLAFTRCTTLPVMTVDQLEINLPYEFRDYITREKEKYCYDYAVLSMPEDVNEPDAQMELMACATLKDNIDKLAQMLRHAGLKLVCAIPEEFAYRNLIRNGDFEQEETICLIDLGHTSTRIHIFSGERFEVTRTLETGGVTLDRTIAEVLGVDEHLARARKEANLSEILEMEECRNVYRTLGMEIMRSINFYNYESRHSLEYAYICGGGSKDPLLMRELNDTLGIELRPATMLLPEECENTPEMRLFITSIGATQQ